MMGVGAAWEARALLNPTATLHTIVQYSLVLFCVSRLSTCKSMECLQPHRSVRTSVLPAALIHRPLPADYVVCK